MAKIPRSGSLSGRCSLPLVRWMVAAACLFLAATLFPAAAAAQAPSIQILLDRVVLDTDVPPQVVGGRTLLPVRVVAQELGFQIHWDEDGGVLLQRPGTTIGLQVGVGRARVNGNSVDLDAPPQVIGGRTLVPVRFISQQIGLEVEWYEATRTVLLWSRHPDKAPASVPPLPGKPDISLLEAAPIGLTGAEVRARWGPPLRTSPGTYGHHWWVYQPDPRALIRVAFRSDRAQAIELFSRDWSFHRARGSMPADMAKRVLNLSDTIHFSSEKYGVSATCSGADNDGWLGAKKLSSQTILILRHDHWDGDVPLAALVTADHLMETLDSWLMRCTIRGAGRPTLAFLPESAATVEREREQQLLQLVNVERAWRGLSPLTWREDVARLARAHSADMAQNNFFSHDSPNSGSLVDRFAAAGIPCNCGENIASGYRSVFKAHLGLMNSPGHRENILRSRYTAAGMGIVGRYYTQNFLVE